jgi:hypothetical protein
MAESFIPVQNASNPGKKVATYEFVNDGGATVQSEAVTLTDSSGDELLGAKPSAESLPVVLATDQAPVDVVEAPTSAALQPGAETPVSAAAVLVLAANPARKAAVIQNTGSQNVRVGVAGVTATTGIRLIPNASVIFSMPFCYLGDVFAIRESADSVVFATEET